MATLGLRTYFAKQYDYIATELADPRTKDWYVIASPVPTLAFVTTYLFLIYVFLPQYMKDRKPYDLKNVIYWYNIFQIGACTALVYKIFTPISSPHYNFSCEAMDYSNNPRAVRILEIAYYLYWVKVIELVETIFFMLRKKYNQVSKLHVYHHATTLTLAWLGTKYFAGANTMFIVMLNSFIHILMYTYYLLSSLGPEWQKKVIKWKSTMTTLQMVQFGIFIIQAAQVLDSNCKAPRALAVMYVPNILLLLNMFWNFFKNSYLRKKEKLT